MAIGVGDEARFGGRVGEGGRRWELDLVSAGWRRAVGSSAAE